MSSLYLHEFLQSFHARFEEFRGMEQVADYGDVPAEYAALRDSAGILDLSMRSRLCLTGADRATFLNGQVTNNIKSLNPGEGCYAALVTAKGKLQSDLNIFSLAEDLLLDFEPGFSQAISERLEKYIIADDVQVVDASPHYGLISVQGPLACQIVTALGLSVPGTVRHTATHQSPDWGDIYIVNMPRLSTEGIDLYIPSHSLPGLLDKLIAAARPCGGHLVGMSAFHTLRMESAIPLFPVDMDETNLAPEAGLDAKAISYNKGCYIGQEVIARIRTYGEVARTLRGLLLPPGLETLPQKGEKLFRNSKEIGYFTSSIFSPRLRQPIALAYVRKEWKALGTDLEFSSANHSALQVARVATSPFTPF